MRGVIVSLVLAGLVAFSSALLVGSVLESVPVGAGVGLLAGCGYAVACLWLFGECESAPTDDEIGL